MMTAFGSGSPLAIPCWNVSDASSPVLDEQPTIEMEIVFRVQRLRHQPDPALVQSVLPETSPLIGNERLERAGATVEIAYLDDHDGGAGAAPGQPDHAIEVTYEGLYELAEETLADGASKLLDEHFGTLGSWIATALVKLGDVCRDQLGRNAPRCGVAALGCGQRQLQARLEQPAKQGRRLFALRRGHLLAEPLEIAPVVEDAEMRLVLAGSEQVGAEPRAAADHLPELDIAAHRAGEDQVDYLGHVEPGVEHFDEVGAGPVISWEVEVQPELTASQRNS